MVKHNQAFFTLQAAEGMMES